MDELSWQAGVDMSRAEAVGMLETRGHGVLCMGAADRGYGLPLSYGYDEEDNRIVFGFVSGFDSKKRVFATEAETVTLTVYDYEDVDAWKSVIVTGTLRPVDEADVSNHFASLFFREDDPDDGDRMIDLDEFERTWYELRIDDISGRKSGRDTA